MKSRRKLDCGIKAEIMCFLLLRLENNLFLMRKRPEKYPNLVLKG